MRSVTIIRVLVVHLGFHAIWVFAYCLSLSGLFILIPLVGLYNAFVLGFMGGSVLASPTRAALLGFVVFSATGLLSGWFISQLRTRKVWLLAFVSVGVTGVLLLSVTLMRYRHVGVPGIQTILPLPTTTGRADADEMAMALKDVYLSAGDVPPYFAGRGTKVPLSAIQPSLPLLSKDYQLKGGPYVYCNLPSEIWRGLKRRTGVQRYPLVWSTQSDLAGKRLVISVDLRTDIFHDELLTEDALSQALAGMETAVRELNSDAKLKLLE